MEAQSRRAVLEDALSGVIDPETGLSVTRMDLIQDLEMNEAGEVGLIFRPASPTCPMAYSLANSIKQALEGIDFVSSVNVKVENFARAAHLEEVLNRAGKGE